MKRSSIWIENLGGGDIQISAFRDTGEPAHGKCLILGIPKRQARAIANRILHEIDFAEGKRARRPSEPHIHFEELLTCMDCGRKRPQPCEGRGGRRCPLAPADERPRMIRCRFQLPVDDSRPVNWPIKHPYWVSGEGFGYHIVVAYADDEAEILANWPEAENLDSTESEGYVFTSRFPKPEWFAGEASR